MLPRRRVLEPDDLRGQAGSVSRPARSMFYSGGLKYRRGGKRIALWLLQCSRRALRYPSFGRLG